jgi:hypothetical protein
MMAKKKSETKDVKEDDFEVGEDESLMRKEWRFQRVAWLILLLIVLAGGVGLLGSGPLSHVQVPGNDGLTVEYNRFAHRTNETEMVLQPGDNVSDTGSVDIAITRDFVQKFNIERIIPEPESESISDDEIVFSFKVGQGAPDRIVFYMTPDSAGSFGGEVRVLNGGSANINMLVYP